MKVILGVLFCTVAVTALTDIEEWKNFKNLYKKSYLNQVEENFRYKVFVNNLQKIREHNEKFNIGETSFRMAVNNFADMTGEEFQKFLGFQRKTKPVSGEKKQYFASEDILTMPESVNWTDAGAVTDVKNQGDCGSCWSFSTVGTVEGQYFKKTGQLVSFSAQNLVDCDKTCDGCNGGLMDRALKYIEFNGIVAEKDYPYRGIDEPCHTNKSSTLVKISSYAYVKENEEAELQKAVASIGPISVAIEATLMFQFYDYGIFNDTTCGNTKFDLNHGVLAVGYGTEQGKDYWIVKNSWGSKWGENGYIRMSRNAKNQCGIATEPVYAMM